MRNSIKQDPFRNLELRHLYLLPRTTTYRYPLPFLVVFLMTLVFSGAPSVLAQELMIRVSEEPTLDPPAPTVSEQLPLSRLAHGARDMSRAWFAGPTQRYQHGVLGDAIEASRLVVDTTSGKRIVVNLPPDRVFEDVEPRFVNLNGDQTDEILVIESHLQRGASLAVYDLVGDRLVQISSTPFLGIPYRWLNPVGVGDFDGDGSVDVALVATPHIGGILRLYRVDGAHLSLFAEYSGVSTHKIGSTELGLGQVISANPRDQLLLPNQTRRRLMLLEWTPQGWREHSHVELPGVLESSLIPVGLRQWRFQLNTGIYYEILVIH